MDALHFFAIECESWTASSQSLEPEATTLVLARLKLSCHCSRNNCSALSCRSSPAGVLDMMVRSSAHSSKGVHLRGMVHHAQVCPSGVALSDPQIGQKVMSEQPCLTPVLTGVKERTLSCFLGCSRPHCLESTRT